MNISLRQLFAFTSVEKFGSFVHAAQNLCLTQAALSHQLRELEENLGFRLFYRTTRSVRLTPEGAEFLPYAARILTNLASAEECAQALSQGKRGVLRISTTEVLASTHVMSAVASFQETHPDIQVNISEGLPDAVIDDLQLEKADIAMGPERPMHEGITSEVLFTTRLVALCAASHPIAHRESLSWRELKDFPVLFAKGGARMFIAKEVNHVVSLDAAREVTHFTTLLAQTSIGKHIGITAAYLGPFLAVYGLKAVPLVRPTMERKVMLYMPRKAALSQVAQSFVAHLKASLRQRDVR